MKSVVKITGEDKIGIIAKITGILAANKVNILDINQTVKKDFFTMVMLVDTSKTSISYVELKNKLEKTGKDMNLSVILQREDIFNKLNEL
ncbi:MAG: ACT domain-containing protein [Bacillota bacterium]|nr:ACT domain-containing protein [Bacillota bacterium]